MSAPGAVAPNEGEQLLQNEAVLTLPIYSSSGGIAADLLQASLDLLQQTLSSDFFRSASERDQRSLRRLQQSLYLWGETHEVPDGALDAILRRSRDLMKIVIAILRSLARNILQGFTRTEKPTSRESAILDLLDRTRFAEQDEDDSDSGTETSDDGEEILGPKIPRPPVNQTLADLSRGLQRLQDLHASLASPVPDVVFEAPASRNDVVSTTAPHQYFANSIREKFPSASVRIVDHLGKENFERYRELRDIIEQVDSENNAERPAQVLIADTASKPQSSKFHDSGFASEGLLTAPSVVQSFTTSLVEGGHSKYPSLPPEARSGRFFKCAACERLIVARRTREYRNHIIHDINPYSCIYESCAAARSTFHTRQQWINHLSSEHANDDIYKTSGCPLCGESLLGEKHTLLIHLAKHLEDISLSVLPQDVDSDEASEISEVSESSDAEASDVPNTSHDRRQAAESRGFDGRLEADLSSRMRTILYNSVVPIDDIIREQITRFMEKEPLRADDRDALETFYKSDEWLNGFKQRNGIITIKERPVAEEAPTPSYKILSLAEYARRGTANKLEDDEATLSRDDKEIPIVEDPSWGQGEIMEPPEITIEFAPPSTSQRVRFQTNSRVSDDSYELQETSSSFLSPLEPSSSRPRGSASTSSPSRDFFLDLADPSRTSAEGTETQSAKRIQKHPATFQCHLCPKRFTRAYNLRSHLRTHTDERPFVCSVCGKGYARQHDRKRHEGLHSGEKKFVCRGMLKDGATWGCGRRFARADALGRHFRSPAGQVCIKPLLVEEAAEREQQETKESNRDAPPSPQPAQLTNADGTMKLPSALLAQYPALAGISWDSLPSTAPGESGEVGYLADASNHYDGDWEA